MRAHLRQIELDRHRQSHVSKSLSLIEKGAAVDHAASNEATALMLAAQNNHEQVARALIEVGARKEVTNSFGSTALSIARSKGHTSICKLLES